MRKLALHLLGNLEIQLDRNPVPEFKSRKSQALLCYLVVTAKQHSREWLSSLFWGDMPEDKARMNLSQSLTSIRRWFQPYLKTSRYFIAVDPQANIWTDVNFLEACLDRQVTALQQAVQLYQGDFLEGFYVPKSPEFDYWMLEERAHCREVVLQALDKLIRCYINQGRSGLLPAIDFTNQRLAVEPWHEGTHRTLMRLYALAGRRSTALKQFDKCRQILLQELEVEPAAETLDLCELIRTGSTADLEIHENVLDPGFTSYTSQEPVLSPGIQESNLPISLPPQPTQFIGREQELDRLDELIIERKSRLVTITGLGGVGKTRLAVEFGQRCSQSSSDQNTPTNPNRDLFPDGVFFVSLEQINPGDSILSAVAEAINFRLDRQDETLLHFLESKQMLLILDNFEHLLGSTGILTAITNRSPDVQLLVTSREHLNLHGEQIFSLQGLPYPHDSKSINDQFSAVQLFLNAALRHDPQFTLSEPDLEYLVRLCQLVDGMPLALELAAAWTASMPVASIKAKIEEDLKFLSGKKGNLPTRQHSIQAVIQGTYAKLPPGEKKIFQHLAVFQGGFSLEAARKVAGADHVQLAGLVNKSLLRFDKRQDRYYSHPLLKLFAMKIMIKDQQELHRIEALHSQYYCQWFADQTDPNQVVAQGQKVILDAMTSEIENTRQAWIWALQQGEFDRLIGKITSIGLYYIWRGGYLAGERMLKSFLDHFDTRFEQTDKNYSLLLAGIYNWLGFFTYNLGAKPYAISLLRESADLLNLESTSDFDTRAEKAHNLMNYARVNPSIAAETRNDYVTKARTLYREVDHPYGLPFALTSSARFAILDGELEVADRYLRESLNIFRRNGNHIGSTISLTGLGNLAFVRNKYNQARKYFQEAIAIAGEFNSPERIIVASLYLGSAQIFSGQFNRARLTLDKCRKQCEERGLQPYQGTALYYLAYTYLHRGNYKLALECAQSARLLAEIAGDQEIMAQSRIIPAVVDFVNQNYKDASEGFRASQELELQNKNGKILFGEDPDHFGLAFIQAESGQVELACDALTNYLLQAVATQRQDKAFYALTGLVKIFWNQGEIQLAVDIFRVIQSYPFIRNSRWIKDLIAIPLRQQVAIDTGAWQAPLHQNDLWKMAEHLLS